MSRSSFASETIGYLARVHNTKGRRWRARSLIIIIMKCRSSSVSVRGPLVSEFRDPYEYFGVEVVGAEEEKMKSARESREARTHAASKMKRYARERYEFVGAAS